MNGKAVFPGGNAQSLNDVAGQPIAEYTHAKSGTVHKLEGPAKAKNIVFKATGDYSDGDTWTLNNTPVTVTYNGGEELLPTAVLIGDMVQAVVMGNQVRLMLQKTTPQESISDNGNFDVNQQNETEYVGSRYTVDRWLINSSSDGYILKVHDGYIEFINNGKNSAAIRQFLEQLPPGTYTMAVLTGNGLKYGTVVWDGSTGVSAPTSFGSLFIGIMSNRIHMSIFVNSGKTEKFYAAKLEPGKRFTGWPAWDYGAELVKCQKYFRVAKRWDFWKGIDVQPNYIDFPFPGLYGMRTKPAIINPEGFNLSKQGFTFELVSFGLSPRLRAAKTNHGLTGALLEANSNIYFDANL